MSILSTSGLQNEIVSILTQKTSFVGPTILAENKLDLDFQISKNIAALEVLILVVSIEGKVLRPDVPGPERTVTPVVIVQENTLINRKKSPTVTVVNAAARLALQNLPIGTCVLQSQDEEDEPQAGGRLYVLNNGTGSSPANWAAIRPASEWADLVMRSLHLEPLSNGSTLVAKGDAWQKDTKYAVIYCTFETRFRLNPDKPE